jgi:hypothetical protein
MLNVEKNIIPKIPTPAPSFVYTKTLLLCGISFRKIKGIETTKGTIMFIRIKVIWYEFIFSDTSLNQ